MRCFLDIAVDGEDYGRVVVAMFDPSTLAAQRFSDLCKGIEGVGYRRSKFDGIFEVRGLAKLSTGAAVCPAQANSPIDHCCI